MKFSHDNISHRPWLHLSRVQVHTVHSDIILPKNVIQNRLNLICTCPTSISDWPMCEGQKVAAYTLCHCRLPYQVM